jgi:hypothetical protein
MKGGPRTTKVEVLVDTRAKLKKLKKDTEARSINDVITALLGEQQQQDEADGIEDHAQEGADEPMKRRVQDALYSLELLTERRGMLEFCTGFDRPAVDLLIRCFCEVSRSSFVFWCCCHSETHKFFNVSLHPYK